MVQQQEFRTLEDLRVYQDLINRATSETARIFQAKLNQFEQFSSEKYKSIGPKYYQTLRAYHESLEPELQNSSGSKDAQSYFRAIAILTHPDKTNDLPKCDQERLAGVFKLANEAYAKGDVVSLQMFLLVVENDLTKQAEHFQRISDKVLNQLEDKAADILRDASRIYKMDLHEFYVKVEESIASMEASIAKGSINHLSQACLPETSAINE